ncbi:MAG: hydroxyacid dehydrogenase [Clostridia bacterium]|nr:hydroxyacid dehydrogenase [Clostridia bacterium]
MNITILDSDTLGDDVNLFGFLNLGHTDAYGNTAPAQIAERIKDSDVVVINKVKLNRENLSGAKKLKLICVAATGYDNIDIAYCKERGIQVSNVIGYSTRSVAQVTITTVLGLATHIREFNSYVASGKYTDSGVANKVVPVYYELTGKTWGIVGLGNIGKAVASVAEAFGCKVIANKRTPDPEFECVSLEELCRRSDVISIHTPLTKETRGLIGKAELELMKPGAILYNAARGAVTDEEAVASAIENGVIGAFGSDVYSIEPFPKDHPMYRIKDRENVLLTPHMAWASYEARTRCIEEMQENIRCFQKGVKRNAVTG